MKKSPTKEPETKGMCCHPHKPIAAIVLLLIGLLWLLSDLGVIALNLPWVPIIVILIALKMLVMGHMWKND